MFMCRGFILGLSLRGRVRFRVRVRVRVRARASVRVKDGVKCSWFVLLS